MSYILKGTQILGEGTWVQFSNWSVLGIGAGWCCCHVEAQSEVALRGILPMGKDKNRTCGPCFITEEEMTRPEMYNNIQFWALLNGSSYLSAAGKEWDQNNRGKGIWGTGTGVNLLERTHNMLMFMFQVRAHFNVTIAPELAQMALGPELLWWWWQEWRWCMGHTARDSSYQGHCWTLSLPRAESDALSPGETCQPLTGRLIYQTTLISNFTYWNWYLFQIWDCLPGL